MKREYMRNEEMKQLFPLIPDLKNIELSLKSELKRLSEFQKDADTEYIESATFGNYELSDMPFANTGETSDKTAKTALSYQKHKVNETKEVEQAKKDIVRDIYCIGVVLDKIDIGLDSIGKVQREILKQKFWENKTWDEIISYLKTQNIFYSKKHIRYKAKVSINKVNSIAMIDISFYQKVTSFIEN